MVTCCGKCTYLICLFLFLFCLLFLLFVLPPLFLLPGVSRSLISAAKSCMFYAVCPCPIYPLFTRGPFSLPPGLAYVLHSTRRGLPSTCYSPDSFEKAVAIAATTSSRIRSRTDTSVRVVNPVGDDTRGGTEPWDAPASSAIVPPCWEDAKRRELLLSMPALVTARDT